MPIDVAKIEQMERELQEAKRQLQEEDGLRYQILKRVIPEEEFQRHISGLIDRRERILFGLELPEEPRGRGRPSGGGERPAKSGGDLTCPVCGKAGLTKRGLSLHMARMHKGEGLEGAGEAEAAA
jgi:hypothetical protein